MKDENMNLFSEQPKAKSQKPKLSACYFQTSRHDPLGTMKSENTSLNGSVTPGQRGRIG